MGGEEVNEFRGRRERLVEFEVKVIKGRER